MKYSLLSFNLVSILVIVLLAKKSLSWINQIVFKMKFILILFMVLGVTFAKVNLKRSIVRIEEQIKVTAENPAQWEKLPTIIGMALPCLGALGVFKVESGGLPKGLQHYIETITPVTFANQLLQVEWGQVSLAANIEPNGWVEDLAAFMNTTKFNQVHELLWTNPEFLDVSNLVVIKLCIALAIKTLCNVFFSFYSWWVICTKVSIGEYTKLL